MVDSVQQKMRGRLAAVLVLASCGPSASSGDEACGPEDVQTHGTLADLDVQECSTCPRATSWVYVTLTTTCEAGVEWRGPSCLIRRTTATNLATQAQFVFDPDVCPQNERLWSVVPGEPVEERGWRLEDFIEEPGDYSFLLELRFDLPPAEFEGTVE